MNITSFNERLRQKQGSSSTTDGVRGVAASTVVISHSANAGLVPSFLGKGFGQTGVVLFFLLSGYLMSKLYLDQPCSFSILKNYLLRRIARILPLYLSALILSALLLYTFDLNIYQNANYRYIGSVDRNDSRV